MQLTWVFKALLTCLVQLPGEEDAGVALRAASAHVVDIDYAKVRKQIRKQPNYVAQPLYALIMLDPQAKLETWVILDKSRPDQDHYDILYFDKNCDGDLTSADERFTGTIDESSKNLLILVGNISIPGSSLKHTEMKFQNHSGKGNAGVWFSLKYHGKDPMSGGYNPITGGSTVYSHSIESAPILRPLPIGKLAFKCCEFGDQGVTNPTVNLTKDTYVQLMLGHPGSADDTFCAVSEHYLVPGKDIIRCTLTGRSKKGDLVRHQFELKKHC